MTKNIDLFHDMHFILDVPVFVTTFICLFTHSPLDSAVSMMMQGWSIGLLGAIFKPRYRHRKTVHRGRGGNLQKTLMLNLANMKTVSHYESTEEKHSNNGQQAYFEG